jgi:uncharacterized surface protein with fasciclin (FAS1) repeats
MLDLIRKLAWPFTPQLLPHGQGAGASPVVQGDRQAQWLTPLWAAAQLQPLIGGSPVPVTLLVPTDAALRRTGSGAWLDAGGARVSELGRAPSPGSVRLLLVDSPLQPAVASLWEQIAAEPGLARLADALERTGLAALLGCAGPFTVFAPSDAGLDRAAARLGLSRRALWSDPARLAELLRQHVVAGRWSSLDLPWGGQLRTWGPTPLQLTPLGLLRAGGCTGQSLADGSDQPCRNGVLHRLHDALLPAG